MDDMVHQKLDKLDDRLDTIDKTLAVNTALLADHIKRTELLEASIKDVESHVTFVRKLIKLCAWIVGAAGALVPLWLR